MTVTDPNQSLHVHMEPPRMDGKDSELRTGKQDEQIEVYIVSQKLQRSQDQAEDKDGFPQDVPPYLEKLDQEKCFVCPQSIERTGEGVVDLILCQTVAEDTLDNETLMENSTEHFMQARVIPDSSTGDVSVGLSGQIEEILEVHVDHMSLTNVSPVQPCIEKAGKDVKPRDDKSSEMEMESMYAQRSCSATSVTSPKVAKSDESATTASSGVKTEVPTDQKKGDVEHLTLPSKCKIRTLGNYLGNLE